MARALPTGARGGVAGFPTPLQGPGQGSPLVLPALATAGRDPSARRGGLQCACASAARPSPARRSSVAGAPQARRGSRAAGAPGEGAPDPRSAGVGAGSGSLSGSVLGAHREGRATQRGPRPEQPRTDPC